MNAAIHFVAGLRPRDHVSSAQRDLHWLPIEQRIVYKLCFCPDACCSHRNRAGVGYIRDLVTPVSHLGRRAHLGFTFYLLRSAAAGLYDVPRTRTLIGSGAFSVAGPKAWKLEQSVTVATFKRHLKTSF